MEPHRGLVPPHGGKLVNGVLQAAPPELDSYEKLEVPEPIIVDAEQIAVGVYSPIDGFMKRDDFLSVLDTMHLANGIVWPIPIILAVSQEQAKKYEVAKPIALVWEEDKEIYAILHLEEKYIYDKRETAQKWFGTTDQEHPGVKKVFDSGDVLLGGKVEVVRKRESAYAQYELTPAHIRDTFVQKGWRTVVGFNTRNVIHRSHEYLQLTAREKEKCDGIFSHPVAGNKKKGDFETIPIIRSYEIMMEKYFDPNQVVFSVNSAVPRYSGPKEAIFTALCKKNYGCSHMIIGRDHGGVKDFYHPLASQEIFKEFPNLGIKLVAFENIVYNDAAKEHAPISQVPKDKALQISGTEARRMIKSGQAPPEWFMRPEISAMLLERIKNGEPVFIE